MKAETVSIQDRKDSRQDFLDKAGIKGVKNTIENI